MVNNPGGNATPAFCLKYNEVGRIGEKKKASFRRQTVFLLLSV